MKTVKANRKTSFLLAGLVLLSGILVAQENPFLSGRASMLREEYAAAAAQLMKAVELGEQTDEALLNLGICHYRLNEFPAAREAFYELEKRKPGKGSLWLAKTEVRLHHPDLALKYLGEHLHSSYRLLESEILLDEDLSSLENNAGWTALWNKNQWYSDEDNTYREALFRAEHGEELEALNMLNALEKQGYRKSLVRQQKAWIYMELGNRKAARSSLQSALKADIRNQDARFALAKLYLDDEKYEEAAKELDILIRREPDRFEAYLLRASARGNSDDLRGAEKDVDTYLQYFPSAHEAIYSKGLLQYGHGKYLDAISSFNTALEMHRGSADYYLARGRAYAATGTNIYAEKDLNQALDLDPFNGTTWFEMASLAEVMGKRQRACDCYRKAQQLGIFEAGEKAERICR